MKQTNISIKKPVTLEKIYRVIAIDKQISKALELLGYDLNEHIITLKLTIFNRCIVSVDGCYFGIWDLRRCTFVD